MFLLLKLLLVLFRPLIWILLLFLYALLSREVRRKRTAFRVALALLVVFTNPLLIRSLLAAYETKPLHLRPSQHFRTGILLGGLVSYSAADDRGYFNNASDRFIQTALLYKEGYIENIVVAAGNGYLTKNDFSEAGFIKRNLMALGVPGEKIFADSASRNTLENAVQAKRLTDSVHTGEPYLLISSALHLPRAQKVFQKAGINAALYPCDFQSKSGGNNFFEDDLLPSSRALLLWDNLIKEWVGRLAYALTGKS